MNANARHSRLCQIGLLVLLLMHATSTIAQEPTNRSGPVPIVITTKTIDIKTESGRRDLSKVITFDAGKVDRPSKLSFRFTPWRTTEEYRNDLSPPTLTSPADITINPGDKTVDVLISFQLDKSIRYGEFKCDLLVYSVDSKEEEIGRVPVQVKVRDASMWPWVVLAVGVIAGVASNWYRNKGQAKDEAAASIDVLQRFVDQPNLPDPFKETVDQLKVDAIFARQASNWASVQENTSRANGIIVAYNRARTAWDEAWAFCIELRGVLTKFRTHSSNQLANSFQKRFEDIKNRFTELDYAPSKARQDLNAFYDKILMFQVVLGMLNDLSEQIGLSAKANADEWRAKHAELAQRFESMTEVDVGPKLDELKNDIQLRIKELHALSGSGGMISERTIKAPAIEAGAVKHLAEPTPSVLNSWSPKIGGFSRVRLRGYRVLGYLFPAIVFIYTGITQFYWSNPVFGSVPEYVALFLWGFAADASSNQVKDFIQRASVRPEPINVKVKEAEKQSPPPS